MPKPHIVLVHGAYHRAWHLQYLKAQLEAAEYVVSSVDLPSCGERPPVEGGLELDTAAVKQAIENAATRADQIIPVLHSYAGYPGSEAVAELSAQSAKKISRLIYLAALIPRQSVALFEPRGGTPPPWAKREVCLDLHAALPYLRWTDTGQGHTILVPDSIPIFYQDVEPGLAQEAASRVVPQSRSCFVTKIKHSGWSLFPTTYILCSDDRTVPPEMSVKRFTAMSEAERANWTFFTINSGHSPFLSQPGETARLIRKIAGENL